jgi:hypothetical protein
MKRERFTPTADDLRLLSEHLFYEVQMTFYLAYHLPTTMGTVLDPLARNAEIEAFTIHLRQLVDFLWGVRSERSGHDAFAADYFAPGEWARLSARPPRDPRCSAQSEGRLGRRPPHLRSSAELRRRQAVEHH